MALTMAVILAVVVLSKVVFVSLGVLLLGLLTPLFEKDSLLGIAQLGSLLATERQGVVSFEPLPEGCSVDNDDSILDQGLGSDQLVVAGVVHNINDPGLAGDGL